MTSTLPIISLVTCSYQQERFIDATMRSVLDQNYSSLDYIVVDGGSQDESANIIAKYSSSLSYWVSEKDAGQTDALKKGFANAQGEIQGWLCSDDLLLPGALQAVGEFFLNNPDVDALYGDALWIDADGKPLRAKREMNFNQFVFLHDHNYIPQPSMFWRKRLYEEVGGLDDSFNLAMDSDLWARFSEKTEIAHIPQYLSCMRFYPEQKTRSMKPAGRLEDLKIRTRGSRLAHIGFVRPMQYVLARVIRAVSKALAGGYGASVPERFLPWLDAHATHAKHNGR
ncbi:MAG: glycosyltransferase family 2 protein [Methylotenera sp.]|uniref:glycosyltransferase family 2 protein n=1 Tax=Methylotenera sp. TaxID=2051956 RepID=UPI0027302AA5|nr:glycosyltransferase family 2 protein [Methylotenera sp.]MDP1523620.1 glycosyltransferase family 2 protein [Methylotenera sp.]